MQYEPDPDYLAWGYSLSVAGRWRESCRLWDIYESLTPTEQRMLMQGDDTLSPGEFEWRLKHFLGKPGL